MKTLVSILLVLTSQPLWGWTLPFLGSGDAPGAVDESEKEQNFGESRERPVYVAINNAPVEKTDGSAPLDIDLDIEESELDQDAEEMRGPPDTEEDDGDEEGSGEIDRDESNEIPGSSPDVPKKDSFSSLMYGILPNTLQNFFNKAPSAMDEFFKKERNNILRLEMELNQIIKKAMNAVIRFNGTTTNTTDVVQDDKGNKFKVETLIKKGDQNQTLVMETIQSIPPLANRTKRSNWLAEPAQDEEPIH